MSAAELKYVWRVNASWEWLTWVSCTDISNLLHCTMSYWTRSIFCHVCSKLIDDLMWQIHGFVVPALWWIQTKPCKRLINYIACEDKIESSENNWSLYLWKSKYQSTSSDKRFSGVISKCDWFGLTVSEFNCKWNLWLWLKNKTYIHGKYDDMT